MSTISSTAKPGRWAKVLPRSSESWPFLTVRRGDGARLDWHTWHLTRWGANRAAAAYVRDGTVTGHRP